jgi:hypothetical protein
VNVRGLSIPLASPGDLRTADGQVWAVVARHDSDSLQRGDTATVTLHLLRVGPVPPTKESPRARIC